MILYKYISDEYWECVLRLRKLRFSQPSILNDPFEFRPSLEPLSSAAFAEEELTDRNIADLAKQMFAEELLKMPTGIRRSIPDGFMDQFAEIIAPYARNEAPKILDALGPPIGDELYKSLDRMIGVLSLSEKNNESLMWAHYARSHHGLVVGFDSQSPFFDRRINNRDDLRHLEKVRYSRRPRVQILDIESGYGIFFSKSEAWAYEREWRILMPLMAADEVVDNGSELLYLFQFPPTCLKEVILGYKMDAATRGNIVNYIEQEADYKHVMVYSVDLDSKEAKLNLSKIEVSRPNQDQVPTSVFC